MNLQFFVSNKLPPITEVKMSSNTASRSNLTIVYQDIAALNPRKSNPRTHSKKQIDQIARAITQFGFTNPVLTDDANGIIAGHGRVAAAKLVGLSQVPTVRLSAMSEAEIRAYVIADNKLAENAG
jgi:ParB-like chromosome segregation protein Spo0J